MVAKQQAKTPKKSAIKTSLGDKMISVITYIIYSLFAFVCVYPFYYIIINSISANNLSERGKVLLYPMEIHFKNYANVMNIPGLMDAAQMTQKLLSMLRASYTKKEAQYGAPVMRELERVMTLRVVDEYWMDHIDAMDDLRQGIRLRAYAQTDPVIEYKREGFEMFEAMTNAIKEEIVRRVFLVRLRTNEEVKRERVAKITGEGGGGDKTVKRQPVVKKIKVGPNDPCPCGSGKKYKKCCRDKDLAAEQGKQA